VLRLELRHRVIECLTCSGQFGGPAVASPHYEIRVSGVLPPEALLDFEYLTASVEPVKTVLYGELADCAALHGLLASLEIFGVDVIDVHRVQQHTLGQR
jgi:hypothetical protein